MNWLRLCSAPAVFPGSSPHQTAILGDDFRRPDWIIRCLLVSVLTISTWLSPTLLVRASEPAAAESNSDDLNLLLELVQSVDDEATQLDVLTGMQAGLAGNRRVAMPSGWPAVYQKLRAHPRAELKQVVQELALIFGQPEALAELRQTASNPQLELAARLSAVATLVQTQAPQTVELLIELTQDDGLKIAAVKGLANFDDPKVGAQLVKLCREWAEPDRSHVVQSLSVRPSTAAELLDAIARGEIERQAVTAFHARQIASLNDAMAERLREVWGEARPASADKAALMEKYQTLLTAQKLKAADVSRGRALFQRTCQKCHRLFQEGESVGPDLTGTNRISLQYLLENILDPNSLVGKDYQLTILTLVDGRVLSGIVMQETATQIRLRTPNEEILVPLADIEARDRSPTSMMPEGQLNDLTPDEVAQLIAYLQHPQQVPLPVDK